MSPAERHTWIADYLRARSVQFAYTVDVLHRAFVDDYIEACGPVMVGVMPYGANRVPQLGRDLAAMFKAGTLTRSATGLEGMAGMGFPRWCYVYRLAAPITSEQTS